MQVGQRLAEAEETISALHEKLAALEKSKVRLTGELDEITGECDRFSTNGAILEKRGRNFDKVINVYK